jgi:hypothetical protein
VVGKVVYQRKRTTSEAEGNLSWANALTPDDVNSVLGIHDKVIYFGRDLHAVIDAAPQGARVCLAHLLDIATQLLGELTSLSNFMRIEVQMRAPADDLVVLEVLRSDIQDRSEYIAALRHGINGTIGSCASIGAVAAEGQKLLLLMDEASSLIEGIGRKVGR